MGIQSNTVDSESSVAELWDEWDGLAVAASRPFLTPGWMLSWWRNLRPERAVLRVVTVRDEGTLIGVAPMFAARGDRRRSTYEFLAAELSPPLGLLAVPGRLEEVAAAVRRELETADPAPCPVRVHDWIGPGSQTEAFVGAWPGGKIHTAPPVPVPIVSLGGIDFEHWMARRRRKFRQEARRRRRRLEAEGGRFSLASGTEAPRAVDSLLELHAARFRGRGRSKVLVPGVRSMLREACERMDDDRLRIFTIEVEGRTVAATALVAAGSLASGWSGGFDPAWSRCAPSTQLALHAVADCVARGEDRLSLGPGASPYKRQLADEEEATAVTTLVPRGRHPLAGLGLVARHCRWALSERLPRRTKERLRRLI